MRHAAEEKLKVTEERLKMYETEPNKMYEEAKPKACAKQNPFLHPIFPHGGPLPAAGSRALSTLHAAPRYARALAASPPPPPPPLAPPAAAFSSSSTARYAHAPASGALCTRTALRPRPPAALPDARVHWLSLRATPCMHALQSHAFMPSLTHGMAFAWHSQLVEALDEAEKELSGENREGPLLCGKEYTVADAMYTALLARLHWAAGLQARPPSRLGRACAAARHPCLRREAPRAVRRPAAVRRP